jgi:malonyl CoA-acyl carrier protein transacylase
MSDISEKADQLSSSQRILLALKEARSKIETLEHAKTEPIAIIGIGCRFPGGIENPEAFWQMLHDGVDAITEVPPERWDIDTYYDPNPDTPGKMYTRYGGFLRQVDQFDPQFFGISPREALSMDPQQRLLLEVSWEALENAGQVRERLTGSKTGVFIGITTNDYTRLIGRSEDLTHIDAYFITGNALNAVAGRLSYILGLQGPSMAIDTACSSSLVAIHLACQSLRLRESDLALAGGVNLILTPEATVALSQARMMAPDGRCKTFDASANGYVRGEGCGMVILKRLSDAVADGDHILALIRGSAVNQDGPSGGLTVPNGPAQQALIRQALASAEINPADVSYVEAHGTGTSLGDPIEFRALGTALSEGRNPEHPLLIGSVKTNIGHLESAAGVAGLIKVVLSLQHDKLPLHLHFKEPNPYIPWNEFPVKVVTEVIPWLSGERQRIAGVSAFGASGTNAYVILEEAPEQISDFGSRISDFKMERSLHLLTLSAKSEEALKELASRYVTHLTDHPELALEDICFTANTGRSHFPYRVSVIAASAEKLQQQLSAFTSGQKLGEVFTGQVKGTKQPRIVFLFTGQGAQYVGMGRELYDTQPTFRRTLDRCDEILRPYLAKPLLEVLYPKIDDCQLKIEHCQSSIVNRQSSIVNETAYTQPALFALEYALAELWKSWGITPVAVLGHSLGEYVAACVAGIFSLEDGLKLVAERALLMQALPGDGQMVAVMADETRVADAIQSHRDEVAISAINGPRNVVISGKREAVEAIIHHLQTEGIKVTLLTVSHAFHSPLMEPMIQKFEQVAREVTFSPPKIPLISNVSGNPATPEIATPEYWCWHIRQPVRFAASMETLFDQGYEVFLEIGPKPTLLGMGRQCLDKSAIRNPQSQILWLPSLRQGRSDWHQLLQSLGELYVHGASVNWVGFDQNYPRHLVVLPTYPFQRQRYWVETTEVSSQEIAKIQGIIAGSKKFHPLLGRRLYSATLQNKELQFESQISQDSPAFLKHHRVFGHVILPTTGYVEMALAAGAAIFKTNHVVLKELVIRQALILPEDKGKILQFLLTPDKAFPGQYSFRIFSLTMREEDEEPSWILHASGNMLMENKDSEPPRIDLDNLRSRCTQEIFRETFYQKLHERGIDYGQSFQEIEQLWWHEGEVLGLIRMPEELVFEVKDYTLHPALLDAAMQIIGAELFRNVGEQDCYLQIGVECLRIYQHPDTQVWSHAQISPIPDSNREVLKVEMIRLFSPDGQVIATIKGLLVKKVSREALLRSTQESCQDLLYQVEWIPHTPLEQLLPPDYLPTPEHIRDQLASQIAQLISQSDLEHYQNVLTQLEDLSIAYILSAFREIGWEFCLSRRFSTAEMAEQLGVISQHQRLLDRLLEILADEEILQRIDGGWEVTLVPEMQDPQECISTLLAEYPIAEAELTLLGRCGSKLAYVLRGEWDPLQLLFPEGDLTTTTQLYQDSPGARVINTLVQQVIVSALANLPQGRAVRILEIGAGTGGTTSYVLPYLPIKQTEYTFTDVSSLFTTHAEDKFRDYPFVRYRVLDIEQPPESQGFESHQYDIVVAANVLHATRDLRQTLHHVKQLLAPTGILVLVEGTAPLCWLDLTFGLTEGWWKFVDQDLRPSYPLLTASQWQHVLREVGFQQSIELSFDEGTEGSLLQQAVIIAQAAEIPQEKPLFEPGNWLIFADEQGVGQQLGKLFRSKGERCTLVYPGEEYEQVAEQQFRVNPLSPTDFQRLIERVRANPGPLKGVVHLWSLDVVKTDALTVSDLETASQKGCGSTLHLIQSLGKAQLSRPPSLWLVTRGAQPVGAPAPLEVAQSTLWGLGKVITMEHPELHCMLIDLDPHRDENEEQALFETVWNRRSSDEIHLAFRQGQSYVARLVHSKLQPQSLPLKSDGTYLITGGLGGLGILITQWLVEHGARHLVLVGRSGASETSMEIVKKLEQAGVEVVIAQADVSQQEQIAKIFAQIAQSLPPVRGIIHAAGVFEDHLLLDHRWELFEKVFAPKVTGSWNLHILTQDMPLDFFVLFSSASSLFGALGLGNYVAANAFLDALAHHRQATGFPGLSINWGQWAGIGMETRQDSFYKARMAAMGLSPIAPEQGLHVLEQALGCPEAQLGVIKADWSVFKKQALIQSHQLFISKLTREEEREKTEPSSALRRELLQHLKEASKPERQELIIAYIQAEVAKVLGLDSSRIDVQQPLNNMGLDSLMAVELRNRIETDLGVHVPMVKFMEGLSVFSLAVQVGEQLTEAPAISSGPSAAVAQPIQEERPVDQIDLSKGIHPEYAEQILAKLDKLDDKKVDKLLKTLLSEKENQS